MIMTEGKKASGFRNFPAGRNTPAGIFLDIFPLQTEKER